MPFNMPVRVPTVAPKSITPAAFASAFRPIGIPDLPPGRKPPMRPAAPKPPAAGTTAPNSSTTATAAIQAILAPIIKQITDAAQTRATQGQQLITGYTNNAVDQLKALDFGAPYKAAEGDQNAVNTALLARLGNQGSGLQNQLAGELGTSVGSPATSAVVGRVGADTTGAGNAGLAKGDATLSSLINQGAAANTYGLKLPGIETLAGLQDAEKLQGAINSDTNSQLQSIEGQVPSMVQNEQSALAKAASDRATLAEKMREFDTSNLTNQQKTRVAALIAAGRVKEAEQVASQNNATKVSIANANNATKANIAATKNEITQAQTSTKNRLAFAKTFGYDPVTGKLIAGYGYDGKGHVVKLAAAPKASRLTAKQIQDYRGTAATIAENAFKGFTDAKNVKHPAIGYSQALDEMMQSGVPKPIAISALAAWYPPTQPNGVARGADVNPATNPKAAGPPAP